MKAPACFWAQLHYSNFHQLHLIPKVGGGWPRARDEAWESTNFLKLWMECAGFCTMSLGTCPELSSLSDAQSLFCDSWKGEHCGRRKVGWTVKQAVTPPGLRPGLSPTPVLQRTDLTFQHYSSSSWWFIYFAFQEFCRLPCGSLFKNFRQLLF